MKLQSRNSRSYRKSRNLLLQKSLSLELTNSVKTKNNFSIHILSFKHLKRIMNCVWNSKHELRNYSLLSQNLLIPDPEVFAKVNFLIEVSLHGFPDNWITHGDDCCCLLVQNLLSKTPPMWIRTLFSQAFARIFPEAKISKFQKFFNQQNVLWCIQKTSKYF